MPTENIKTVLRNSQHYRLGLLSVAWRQICLECLPLHCSHWQPGSIKLKQELANKTTAICSVTCLQAWEIWEHPTTFSWRKDPFHIVCLPQITFHCHYEKKLKLRSTGWKNRSHKQSGWAYRMVCSHGSSAKERWKIRICIENEATQWMCSERGSPSPQGRWNIGPAIWGQNFQQARHQ